MMNTRISTLIVDDEPAARRTLRAMLDEFASVQVIGEAAGVADAARLAAAHDPELILLDITMPVRSGFELLPLLTGRAHVIFVTAFDEYAVRAFEFHAIDYLLKPIRRERLQLALERVRGARGRPADDSGADDSARAEIVLQAEGQVRVVPVGNITCIKAVGNYSQVNLTGGAGVLVRRSMDEWEELLPGECFLRPHRSLIVNLRLMQGVRTVSRDMAEISLHGCKAPITVGRRASLLLRRMLQQAQMGRGGGALVARAAGGVESRRPVSFTSGVGVPDLLQRRSA